MAKGVSLEEKRKRILSIFHESGEFYQLKDIEKLGTRRGVVAQSIKDILMSLVDDNLVITDKIGTSNYFWSYPSAAMQTKENKMNDLQLKVDKELERQKKLDEAIIQERQQREETEERELILKELKEQQSLANELKQELQKYQDNDPQLYEAKENAAKVARDATNRWTENIWEIQSYCIKNFNMDRNVFNQNFGIDDDLDTI
ncbi:meiotic nuclear division protein 1 [Mycotypha africana]|uniref:meiotic nuclear division protein 1 n=1 Tax=Mycotypha africana TaxID=64632 RepID=UPI002300CA4E|nr:meiotic nuclear division protein 1 [Mycotypha africana]KAI8987409.1 meiotic nuclear division protein 1 [Mycotypha africana]